MAVRLMAGGGEGAAGMGSVNVAELAALMASKQQPTEEKEQLKLSRRDMRLLRQQITSQHPALCSDSAIEERDEPPPGLETATSTRFTSRLTSPSATASHSSFSAGPTPALQPKPATGASSSAASFYPSTMYDPSLTPRIAFSQKRVDKFDESVKVIMAFGHDEMEHIRTEILKRGGGVTRSQFLAIAVKQSRPAADAPLAAFDAYYREVEALAEMFEEIDVNGDGDLQYSEFTSYLVELANGRYDHHHIDQLLHTDYRVLEPVGNDDRIDVVSVVWYGQLGHFVLFEKGQNRFKVLDGQKRVVKVVRGHMGEMIDSEWLPLHGVLVTSSSDRTIKFWSVEERSAHDDSRAKRRSAAASVKSAGSFTAIPRASSISSSASSSAFPVFHCLATWSLPSPQVSLCWCHGRLYSADILGRLLVWNVDVGEIRHSTHAHEGRVTALCSGDDGWLISGGMDGWVRVWEGSELRLVDEWRHDGGVRAVCWDSERRLVLSGGDDECVRVWSGEQRKLLRTINFRTDTDLTNKPHNPKPHTAAPSTARTSHTTSTAASLALSPSTAASSSTAAELAASGDSILGLSVCGVEVLVMSQYGVLRVMDAGKWRVEQTLVVPRVWDDKGRDEEEEEGDSDEDDDTEDGTDKQLSLRARELITSFTVIKSAACSPPLPSTSSHYTYSHTPPPPAENIIIASAGSRLYAFTRNTAVNHHVADSHAVLAALYNPTTFSILTAAHRSLKVWDACTGRLLKEFHDIVPRGSVVSCVVLDGRGRKVVVGGTDGRVSVFNCQTGAEMQRLDRHDGEVACLSYVEEVERADDGDGTAAPTATSSGNDSDGICKVLCACRTGVYIHHDDHEAAPQQLVVHVAVPLVLRPSHRRHSARLLIALPSHRLRLLRPQHHLLSGTPRRHFTAKAARAIGRQCAAILASVPSTAGGLLGWRRARVLLLQRAAHAHRRVAQHQRYDRRWRHHHLCGYGRGH